MNNQIETIDEESRAIEEQEPSSERMDNKGEVRSPLIKEISSGDEVEDSSGDDDDDEEEEEEEEYLEEDHNTNQI